MSKKGASMTLRHLFLHVRASSYLPFMGLLRNGLLAISFITASASAQAPLDVRIALIIGNSAYPGSPLLNPANDAREMSQILRQLGFQVLELRDGNKAQMLDSINKMTLALKNKQGIGMLYYAGHGLQLDWQNYMVPVDADLLKADDVPKQTVGLNAVMEAFKLSGSRMNILVLDACRDNPFAGGTSSGKGLAQLDAPPSTFLAYATAPGNVAEDGDSFSGNGLYTQFLLQELQKPTTKIEDVFKRVRLQVRRQSQGRQIPWESTSLEDDFMFNDGAKYTLTNEYLERVTQAALKRERDRLAAEARRLHQQREAAELAIKEAQAQQNQQKLQEAQRLQTQAQEKERLLAIQRQQEQAREQTELARVKEIERVAALAQSGTQKRLSKEEQQAIDIQEIKAAWAKIKDSQRAEDFYSFLERFPNGGDLTEAAQYRLNQLARPMIQASLGKGQDASLAYTGERFKVGDVFQYQTSDVLTNIPGPPIVNRVTDIQGDLVFINDGAIQSTRLSAFIKNPRGSFDPPFGGLPAEFQVGKTVQTRSTNTAPNGQIFQVEQRIRIVGRDTIKVPAGTFQTYLLEITLSTSNGGFGQIKAWVNPQYGLPIKREEIFRVNGRLVRTDRLELAELKAPRD
jgi:multidrug efflux pump subunit AcrA (membrane-fusion protein)